MSFFKPVPLYHPLLALLMALSLAGCAAAGAVSTVAQVANLALGAAGLTKPSDPNATSDMSLQIRAGLNLNTDNDNHPYSVVVRVYQLRKSESFLQAYYDVFLDPQKEKAALGSDVIDSKEITLLPGQNFIDTEKLSVKADYIGIIALFQAPAAERWKLIFPSKDINSRGIAIGISACSMTVDSGTTLGSNEASRLALKLPARCG